ncbi:hypothetical protein Btru_066800 [Bulinus truncatus]|nr:hypothetical protein Btru_066800 [Bulinus truncatus]
MVSLEAHSPSLVQWTVHQGQAKLSNTSIDKKKTSRRQVGKMGSRDYNDVISQGEMKVSELPTPGLGKVYEVVFFAFLSNSESIADAFAGTIADHLAGSKVGPTAGAKFGPKAGSIAAPTAGSIAGPTAGSIAGPTAGYIAGPTAGSIAGSTAGSIVVHSAGSIVGPTAGSIAGPTAGSIAGPTAGSIAGPTAGSIAGPTAGSIAGPTAGSIVVHSAGSIVGPTAGSIAGPTAGSIAGPTSGSIAGPTAGSIVVHSAGSIVGPTAGSIAGPTAGSKVGPTAGSIAGSTAGSIAGPTAGSIAGPTAGSIVGPTAGSIDISSQNKAQIDSRILHRVIVYDPGSNLRRQQLPVSECMAIGWTEYGVLFTEVCSSVWVLWPSVESGLSTGQPSCTFRPVHSYQLVNPAVHSGLSTGQPSCTFRPVHWSTQLYIQACPLISTGQRSCTFKPVHSYQLVNPAVHSSLPTHINWSTQLYIQACPLISTGQPSCTFRPVHSYQLANPDMHSSLPTHINWSTQLFFCYGNTALIHSANVGNDVALELLVRNFRRLGLQVDHFNKAGYTALHVAAMSGYLQCAKILALKGKASLTTKDKVHQMTPLEWCLKQGYQKTEVEFLKPSAKFYRLAKLTTTMAKYRKKSTQESLLSTQGGSPRSSPQRSSEKTNKGKMKGLLKKSKAHSTDDSPEPVPKQKENDFKFFDKFSSAKTEPQAPQKKMWSRSNKQRSFSASDQTEENSKPDPIVKAVLTHSRSHPTDGGNSNGRLMLHGHVVSLSDELGEECDTDDLCFSDSDSNIIRFSSPNDADTSRASSALYTDGGVYCGTSPSNSGGDVAASSSRQGDCSSSSPYFAEGGVYCGYTAATPRDPASGRRSSPQSQAPENTNASTSPDINDVDDRSSDSDNDVDDEYSDSDVNLDEMSERKSLNDTGTTFLETDFNPSTTKIQESTKGKHNDSRDGIDIRAQDRADSATPLTESESLESQSKFSPLPEASEPEAMSTHRQKAEPINQKLAPSAPCPQSSASTAPFTAPAKGQMSPRAPTKSNLHKTQQRNSTNAARDARDVASPVTEIESLDLSSSPDDTHTSLVRQGIEEKTHELTRGQTVKESNPSNRDTFRKISMSPKTEIEYIDDDAIPTKNNIKANMDFKQNKTLPRDETVNCNEAKGKTTTTVTSRDTDSPQTEVEYLDLSEPPVVSRPCTPKKDAHGDRPTSQRKHCACPTMTSGQTVSDVTARVVAGVNGSDFVSQSQTVPLAAGTRALSEESKAACADSKAAPTDFRAASADSRFASTESRAASTDSSGLSSIENSLTHLQDGSVQSRMV